MKILIVDDELPMLKLLVEILSSYGQCDIASDGEEALRLLGSAWEEGQPYDLVCLDIMMPNMDGHRALKEIRQVERAKGLGISDRVRVIMLTVLNDMENVLESFYAGGASSYLVKPITSKELIGEMRELGLIA